MTGRIAVLACFLFVITSTGWARDVVVGVLGDGLQSRAVIPVELLQKEFSDLMQPEFNVRMPMDKQLNGGWTVEGVRSALNELLNDPEVEVIVANGVVASHLAGQWGKLKKPVIAPIVIDAKLQGFAERREALRSNFVYLSSFHSVDDDLTLIRNAVPFSHLAVLVQRVTLEGVPAIQAMTERLRQNPYFEVSVIAVEDSVDDLISQIPEETDMVYVAPLFRLDDQQMKYLAQRLIARKLPSFSLLGKLEVEMGLMMSATGLTADHTRLARRIALTLQALLLNEADPAPRSPDIGTSRLVINMATARAIGVLPRWAVLTGAEKLFDNEYDDRADHICWQLGARILHFSPELVPDRLDVLVFMSQVDLDNRNTCFRPAANEIKFRNFLDRLFQLVGYQIFDSFRAGAWQYGPHLRGSNREPRILGSRHLRIGHHSRNQHDKKQGQCNAVFLDGELRNVHYCRA